MQFPRPLSPGDLIAIVSPATTVRREYVDGAFRRLREIGFRVAVAPHVLGPASGTFAASDSDRTADFLTALEESEVRAILCARGGYGCVHLLPAIPPELVKKDPKWLIGFSDVSALHAFWQSCGVASIHASMAKHISEFGLEEECSRRLLSILSAPAGSEFSIRTEPHPLNSPGKVCGCLRGGNLAVLDGLASTPFDILKISPEEDRVIMFLEDIAEPIYKVERILTRLYLSGTLTRLAGLIIGQFTEYRPDSNFPDVESMIRYRLDSWHLSSLPVAFGFPIGHIDRNFPVVEGASASLEITPAGAELKYSLK